MMKIKEELLKAYMATNNYMISNLVQIFGVCEIEIYKLLSGEKVGVKTAKQFIDFFGADEAARMIDWVAIGKKNPFDKK